MQIFCYKTVLETDFPKKKEAAHNINNCGCFRTSSSPCNVIEKPHFHLILAVLYVHVVCSGQSDYFFSPEPIRIY
jgi:hypothetical protein